MKVTIISRRHLRVVIVFCALRFLTMMPEAHGLTKPAPEPRPDLTVLAAVYKEPNVAVRLTNAGDATAPASELAILLLKKIDPDTNSPVALKFPIPSLAPGKMIEKTFNVGNNSFTDNGSLAVKVDYKNQIAESNERNNKKQAVPYQAPLLPDLVIQSVEIIKGTASVYVFNKCKGNSGSAILDVTTYKGTNNQSGFESQLGVTVPPLAGNTGVTLVVDPKKYGTLTKSLSGRYIRVEVDLTNKLKETIDTNNWWENGTSPFPDPANSCDPPK